MSAFVIDANTLIGYVEVMQPNELKTLRKKIGARQKDLAIVLGVPFRTYQNWEQPPGSKAHRQIPDDVAERVRCLVELKGDGGGTVFPNDLTWLQVPLRKKDVEELNRRAAFLDKSPSVLIREVVFKILQTHFFDLEKE